MILFNEWTGKIEETLQLTFTDINFGMFRLCSSQKAETLELVTERIKDFGLSMDDIVAFVIMKLLRLAPFLNFELYFVFHVATC